MRLALAVLLLVGCAVGRQAGSNTFPASREKCLEAVQKHWISADMCSVYGPRGAKPSDCYRVKQDGSLEKVDWCGKELETQIDTLPAGMALIGPPPEPADVPAIPNPVWVKDYCTGGTITMYWFKPDGSTAPIDVPECRYHEAFMCVDKNRILIGPDGHGKYFCHLPQTNH